MVEKVSKRKSGDECRDPESAARLQERRSHTLFAAFGLAMMAMILLLPFALSERSLSWELTLLQVLVWIGLCVSWLYQGKWASTSGVGFEYETPVGKRRRVKELVLYLFGFGPLCYIYIYVTWQNAEYFGFNYVLLFVLAGFSTLMFPLWGALLYLAYQTFAWLILAYLLWGQWRDFEDLVMMFSGYLFSAMMFYVFRKERRSRSEAFELSSELDKANEKLRKSSRMIEELAATQERNRIAREIHDTIGHSLTVVNMQLETAIALMDTDASKAKSFLEKAQRETKKGLGDIRSSVASLRSSPLDGKSLPQALEALLASVFPAGVEAVFLMKGDPSPLKAAAEAALYRSAQEALTNVRKHADASEVRVELDLRDPRKAVLSVSDNGKGCEEAVGGFGIMGIRERIQLLDGSMEVSSSPGKGLRLSVSLPR